MQRGGCGEGKGEACTECEGVETAVGGGEQRDESEFVIRIGDMGWIRTWDGIVVWNKGKQAIVKFE